MKHPSLLLLLTLAASPTRAETLTFDDPSPQRYQLQARASELDPRAREHPAIDFIFEKEGKPWDLENASVDTSVPPQGKLVIWMMSHNGYLFERLNSYGLHAIQPHYANKWFGKVCRETPVGENCRGNVRLEAATGEDFSDVVDISKPDGMMERARQFVKWLSKENPAGRWDFFLTGDGKDLRWDRVIMSGSSHGSTTSARFAKHQRVDRVVMLCGPRDQYQTWQAGTSATPPNRFFGFSHVLDGGWVDDHYCRSWELLGLAEFGPIVNVDSASPPYGKTRRLISAADVGGDIKRAHSAVTPGSRSPKDSDGALLYEPVWRYLYTHPIGDTGDPGALDPNCVKDQRGRDFAK